MGHGGGSALGTCCSHYKKPSKPQDDADEAVLVKESDVVVGNSVAESFLKVVVLNLSRHGATEEQSASSRTARSRSMPVDMGRVQELR